MFQTTARKIAEENLRLARESSDAETVTKALAEYNRVCDREDRTRGRRARAKRKSDATAKPAPVDLNEAFEEEFIFTPPPPAPLTPVVSVTVEAPPPLELDAPSTPAAQMYGVGDGLTVTRQTGGCPWDGDNPPPPNRGFDPFAAEQCVAHHEYQCGSGWTEITMQEAEAEQNAAYREYFEKLGGR